MIYSLYILITSNLQLFITILTLLIGGFWSLFKFREYLRDKRFDRYHTLIRELVDEQIEPDKKKKLHRQIAIIFELRNFDQYFPVSKRILNDLKKSEGWKQLTPIVYEIDITIEYASMNPIQRLIYRCLEK